MQNNRTMTIDQFSTLLKAEEKNEMAVKLQQMAERVNTMGLRSAHKRLQENVNRYGWW